MNILITTSQGGIAGSTYSVLYLAKGLHSYGNKIHIACSRKMPLTEMINREPGLVCHNISFEGYLDFKSVTALARIVKQHRIQVINAQSGVDRTICILAKWLFRLKTKVVFTRRQRPRDEPWIKRWFHLKGADRIVVISDELKKLFLNKGYPQNSLKVIYNGVETNLSEVIKPEKVEALRGMLGLTEYTTIIGCLARLKQQEQLIESLKYLDGSYVILFVGIDRYQVQHAIENHKPTQRIIFTGRIPREEALHYLPLMHVKVLPSGMDGFGRALVEAMLLKIPVIGTRFGGIRNIIEDRKTGFLFDQGNARELADRIIEITKDHALRESLVKAAYKKALTEFGIERTVKEYQDLFYDTVGVSN